MSVKRKARGQTPQFHANADIDRMLAIITGLSQEVSVLRDRLDTHERLLAKADLFGPAEVENFDPSPGMYEERQAARRRFIATVYRPVLALAETETEAATSLDYQEFVEQLEAMPKESS